RLEMERQLAVIAIARDDRGRSLVNPDVGHAGPAADRAGIDIGRRAVEQHAGASLRIVAGHDAPDRFRVIRHRWSSRLVSPSVRAIVIAFISHHDRRVNKGAARPPASAEKVLERLRPAAWIIALASALTVLSVSFAAAQAQNFPNHPIKIIIGPSPDIFS